MAVDPRVLALIIQGSRKYNLDEEAVIKNALGEGGLAYGARGDNNTSFGPFQLHVGGALPSGRGEAWANSPAGIDYALRQMGRVAGGLRGKAALAAIVSKFERPSDIPGQITKRWGLDASPYLNMPRNPAKTLVKATRSRSKPVIEQKWVTTPGMTAQEKLNAKRSAILDYISSANQAIIEGSGPASIAPLLARVNEIRSQPEARQVLKTIKTFTQNDPIGDKVPDARAPVRGSNSIVRSFNKYLGTPYTWGGNDKSSGMDCSGLVRKVLADNGVDVSRLGRTTFDLVQRGKPVNIKNMRPGDVVFWDWGGRAGPDHMGFYLGNGKYGMASGKAGEIRGQYGGRTKIVDAKDYAAPFAVRRMN